MIEPARSCLKKIRLSFPQNGIFALFDSTYFWRVFFGVLCFQQKLFFFSAFVLLRIEKGAVAELSVLLQLLFSVYFRFNDTFVLDAPDEVLQRVNDVGADVTADEDIHDVVTDAKLAPVELHLDIVYSL